jgi:hypothetical protein
MKSDFVIKSRIGIGVHIFEEPNPKQGFLFHLWIELEMKFWKKN